MKRQNCGNLRRARLDMGVQIIWFSLVALLVGACGDDSSSTAPSSNSGDRTTATVVGANSDSDADDSATDDGEAGADGTSDDGEASSSADGDEPDESAEEGDDETDGSSAATDADAGTEQATEPEMTVTGVMGGEEVVTSEGDEIVLAKPGEAADSLAKLVCASARTCCGEAGEGVSGLVDCEETTANGLDLWQAVRKGFVVVDQAVLEACIAAADKSTLTCSARKPEMGAVGFLAAVPQCLELLYGIVPEGGNCSWDEMCEQDGENVARCVPDLRSGRVCRSLSAGTAGDACVTTSGPAGTVYVQQGDDAAMAECRNDEGLWCAQEGSSYVCTPTLEAGAECPDHLACGANAYCDGVCKPLLSDGAACLSARQCDSLFCSSDLKCASRIVPAGVNCSAPSR